MPFTPDSTPDQPPASPLAMPNPAAHPRPKETFPQEPPWLLNPCGDGFRSCPPNAQTPRPFGRGVPVSCGKIRPYGRFPEAPNGRAAGKSNPMQPPHQSSRNRRLQRQKRDQCHRRKRSSNACGTQALRFFPGVWSLGRRPARVHRAARPLRLISRRRQRLIPAGSQRRNLGLHVGRRVLSCLRAFLFHSMTLNPPGTSPRPRRRPLPGFESEP